MKFKFPVPNQTTQPPPPAPQPPPPRPVNPPHRGEKPRPEPEPVEAEPNEFGKTLEDLLGNKYAKTAVSEEELYAALILHQIKQKFGEDHFDQWKSYFKLITFDSGRGNDKEVSAERAANETVKLFVESKLITASEAKRLKSRAFEIAQLDDRSDRLWDKYGGDPENTRAVASFARAQKLMQKRLNEIEETASVRQGRYRSKSKRVATIG